MSLHQGSSRLVRQHTGYWAKVATLFDGGQLIVLIYIAYELYRGL